MICFILTYLLNWFWFDFNTRNSILIQMCNYSFRHSLGIYFKYCSVHCTLGLPPVSKYYIGMNTIVLTKHHLKTKWCYCIVNCSLPPIHKNIRHFTEIRHPKYPQNFQNRKCACFFYQKCRDGVVISSFSCFQVPLRGHSPIGKLPQSISWLP